MWEFISFILFGIVCIVFGLVNGAAQWELSKIKSGRFTNNGVDYLVTKEEHK